MVSIYLVLIVLAVILIQKWLSNYMKIRKILETVPGPKQYPLIGIAPLMMGVPPEDRLAVFNDLCYQFKNGMFLIWFGTQPVINIRKPHQIEKILTSTTIIKKSRFYNFVKPWLGEGLITTTGTRWFNHRRLITPAFHFGVLGEYSAVMRENVQALIELIDKECNRNPKAPINIFDIIGRYTLDTICETAMGVSVNAIQQPDNEYCQALHNITRLFTERVFRFWLASDFIYNKTPSGKQFRKAVKIMHKFTEKVIMDKHRERAEKKISGVTEIEEDNVYGKRKPKAFLDLLLDASENADSPLSLEELREEVDTFMFAGQDTTAMGICNALFALGNAPEIQEKVYQEMKEVIGDSDEVATASQLGQLKFLDRVIKEALRIYPSAPSIGRCTEHDIVIDGHLIPKGTSISLNIYQAHHDPESWPDPETFDPDRFLPENSKGRHIYSYFPFSAGPRNCIGKKFAYLELKTVLTAILRKWKVSSVLKPSEMKMVANITLRPANEKIELYFTPHNNYL
ncbi:cytochrome P450 4C1-like [Copidosoma floridanum]|uniref:cytochrome P450 4C1-like n=1 Tax=Copidosoma floridanum TaxID=29053 RepID=UPI000C6F49C9|nr:cytochrome P450 4C1-like [Copidosoma floridanum]